MKKILALLGFISLTLGIIGAFLPLLPTTPFILLSAYLFAKSSDRMYNWLTNHKIFGKLIVDYQKYKTIPVHAKILAISMLSTSILISVFTIASGKLWLQILLICIAVGAIIHILSYKSKRE